MPFWRKWHFTSLVVLLTPPTNLASPRPVSDDSIQVSGDLASETTQRVLVVIPTYNERANIERLVREVLDQGSEISVLIVDDNSPDGTGEVVDQLVDRLGVRVRVLHRDEKRGIGSAYIAGFRRALDSDAHVVVTMDADFSHAPRDLPRLIEKTTDADLVLGSRYVPGGRTEGWPLHRRLLSRLGGIYSRTILGVPVQDLTGGFKAFRREGLEQLDLSAIASDGYVFQIETTYRAIEAGLHVAEVPIVFEDRVSGSSKLSRWIVLEAIVMVWKLRLSGLLDRLR